MKFSGFSTVTPFEFAGFTSLAKKKGKNCSKLHIFQYTYHDFLIKTDKYKIRNHSEEISVFLLHISCMHILNQKFAKESIASIYNLAHANGCSI